jgi:hypothetical protein
MGLFDLLFNRGLTASVRFKFAGLRTCVLEQWHVPRTDDRAIAQFLGFTVRFFGIAHQKQIVLMAEYLRDVTTGRFRFEKDTSENVYSHAHIWIRIHDETLSPLHLKASRVVFPCLGPFYYTAGDTDDTPLHTEYLLKTWFKRGIPYSYFRLGRYSPVLLPLSLSVFAHHTILQLKDEDSPKKLENATEHIVAFALSNGITMSRSSVTNLLSEATAKGQLHV